MVSLSSTCVQSGIDPQMDPRIAQALALLPLSYQTVPVHDGSRANRGAVGKSAKAKQEQWERTVRKC